MSALHSASSVRAIAGAGTGDAAVALLGTGVVGGAFLRLLDTPAAAAVRLVGAANSRHQQTAAHALARRNLRQHLQASGDPRDDVALLAALDASTGPRIIIDATAADAIADQHAFWLGAGYHVVTANKVAVSGPFAQWRALAQAGQRGRSRYGDAATVGAGLPAISSVRRLHACGDRLRSLGGAFSGSLSWLFSHFDGSRPFSKLLHEARELGYSEPDPRADLAGTDVARKLLILARNAGYALEPEQINVQNLVPQTLRDVSLGTFLARSAELDVQMAEHLAGARAGGGALRYVAHFRAPDHAEVGLHVLPANHPAARVEPGDNLFVVHSDRYRERPLCIAGPGAGAEVTAQALLGDVLAIARATL